MFIMVFWSASPPYDDADSVVEVHVMMLPPHTHTERVLVQLQLPRDAEML